MDVASSSACLSSTCLFDTLQDVSLNVWSCISIFNKVCGCILSNTFIYTDWLLRGVRNVCTLDKLMLAVITAHGSNEQKHSFHKFEAYQKDDLITFGRLFFFFLSTLFLLSCQLASNFVLLMTYFPPESFQMIFLVAEQT